MKTLLGSIRPAFFAVMGSSAVWFIAWLFISAEGFGFSAIR